MEYLRRVEKLHDNARERCNQRYQQHQHEYKSGDINGDERDEKKRRRTTEFEEEWDYEKKRWEEWKNQFNTDTEYMRMYDNGQVIESSTYASSSSIAARSSITHSLSFSNSHQSSGITIPVDDSQSDLDEPLHTYTHSHTRTQSTSQFAIATSTTDFDNNDAVGPAAAAAVAGHTTDEQWNSSTEQKEDIPNRNENETVDYNENNDDNEINDSNENNENNESKTENANNAHGTEGEDMDRKYLQSLVALQNAQLPRWLTDIFGNLKFPCYYSLELYFVENDTHARTHSLFESGHTIDTHSKSNDIFIFSNVLFFLYSCFCFNAYFTNMYILVSFFFFFNLNLFRIRIAPKKKKKDESSRLQQ
ncbi:hypothetical protein RFI_02626 [Reticulomyxa filosa]|uniref:Uncharacterized protein n=1 Tax=Reticulomyxa filosa TaxID=46433 RepID=X6P8M9_RETFI|nr:hypothetical protein RFI_02626 [Reticulomyxa filosa]|eukprot:ETO34468.1 hypothetical protein RFI_02626 [Reticulomyxa filosa]